LEKDETYFFPTAIYDWYLTEPAHNANATWTYAYIPETSSLHETVANRDARKDFFHFVRPLSDGLESAYIMHGNRYLPQKYFLDVSAASKGYMAQTLFTKETLPVCKLARYEATDSASVNAIHTVAAASPLTFPSTSGTLKLWLANPQLLL
jgi:hypothetical protein